ncbi:MAG TPA: hypothetical protein VGQ81_10140, partial [Acidobacteriota bacterium]|nr:hypothetical protein [Acidobacteriota bacterium]
MRRKPVIGHQTSVIGHRSSVIGHQSLVNKSLGPQVSKSEDGGFTSNQSQRRRLRSPISQTVGLSDL